ncbi:MAG: hypothetical protein IPG93_24595 [Burkholderiales bacterium]|nr:hypothetical protein [Burkholderiales bacterium]
MNAFDEAWAEIEDLMIEQDDMLGPNDGEVPSRLSGGHLRRCEEIRLILREVIEAGERVKLAGPGR